MKIAVAAHEPDVGAWVHARLGRAPYFATLDLQSGEWAFHPNVNTEEVHGAGSRAAQSLIERGVSAVVSGAAGPEAFRTLQAGGVVVYLALGLKVAEAADALRRGGLFRADNPSVPAHTGLGVLDDRVSSKRGKKRPQRTGTRRSTPSRRGTPGRDGSKGGSVQCRSGADK